MTVDRIVEFLQRVEGIGDKEIFVMEEYTSRPKKVITGITYQINHDSDDVEIIIRTE